MRGSKQLGTVPVWLLFAGREPTHNFAAPAAQLLEGLRALTKHAVPCTSSGCAYSSLHSVKRSLKGRVTPRRAEAIQTCCARGRGADVRAHAAWLLPPAGAKLATLHTATKHQRFSIALKPQREKELRCALFAVEHAGT